METVTYHRRNIKKEGPKEGDAAADSHQKDCKSHGDKCCSPKNKKEDDCKHHKHANLKETIEHFIGMRSDVPAHIGENEYIITGYRVNFSTPGKIIKSLFIKHNEAYNVWSHLVGWVVVLLVIFFLVFNIIPAFQQNSVSKGESRFSAILNELPDLDQIEAAFKHQIEATKENFRQFKETYGHELQTKLESAMEFTEKFVRNNIQDPTPNALKHFFESIEGHITEISQTYKLWQEQLGSSFADTVVVNQLSQTSALLKQRLIEIRDSVQETLWEKFDSEKYDWVDVYKYIDARDHSVQSAHTVHRWPIFVFLFSAAFCLMGSSTFHLASCMNDRIGSLLARWDYAGISILITGSCFPPVVYGFYCQPTIAWVYLSILSVVSMVVFIVSIGKTIHLEEYRRVKGVMYGGLGLFSALPIFHLVYNEFQVGPGSDNLPFVASMPYYLAMGACYLGGLFLYTTRIPEKFIPGKVDNCGNSHNLWHTLILIAIVFHYFGCFENYYTRMEIGCNA